MKPVGRLPDDNDHHPGTSGPRKRRGAGKARAETLHLVIFPQIVPVGRQDVVMGQGDEE